MGWIKDGDLEWGQDSEPGTLRYCRCGAPARSDCGLCQSCIDKMLADIKAQDRAKVEALLQAPVSNHQGLVVVYGGHELDGQPCPEGVRIDIDALGRRWAKQVVNGRVDEFVVYPEGPEAEHAREHMYDEC